MECLIRSAVAFRQARRSLIAIKAIPLRAPVVPSSWLIIRSLCASGTSPLPHQGTVKKETLPPNGNDKYKEEEAALYRWFEQWMAEYGKVYPNEDEKAMRFEYFKGAVKQVERYIKKYGEGACVLNELSAEEPEEWVIRRRGYTLLPRTRGDSNVIEEDGADMAEMKKLTNKTWAVNHTYVSEEAALYRWFEQWMAEYGKVYSNEVEKAMRFEYFKNTVRTATLFNKNYETGGFVLNEYAAESPKERFVRSHSCTLSPHVIAQLDPIIRQYFGVKKVI